MGINQYTYTGQGGVSVEPKASKLTNAVEIRDQETGRVYDSITDITDLRNARQLADPGELVYVYPGEYVTRDLLKDQVNWHFEDGAVVKNPESGNGMFFSNNGGGRSTEDGPVTTEITGKAEFIVRDTGSGDFRDQGVFYVGASSSDIYFECKKIRDATSQDQTTIIYPHSADFTADIGEFVMDNTEVYTSFVDLGMSYPPRGDQPADTENTDTKVNVGTYDMTGLSVGAESDYMLTGFGSDWRGDVELDVSTFKTPSDHTVSYEVVYNDFATDQGSVRLWIRDHEGTMGNVIKSNSNKTFIIEDLNVNISETQPSGDPTSGFSFVIKDNTEVYFRNGQIMSPGFSASVGNFPLLVETVDGSTPAGSTVTVLGDLEITGGSAGVDPDVTVNGVGVESIS